jgi:hypothetical protein
MSQHKNPISPNPVVWGPHYWFFLHSVAYYYPIHPNETTKRKYYDLIQNMPLFIPTESIGNKFSRMLDKYPVRPYLDTRESFMRWVNFIHNKINYTLGKEEMGIDESIREYEKKYDVQQHTLYHDTDYSKYEIYSQFAFVAFLSLFLYYCYRNEDG